MRFSLNVQCKPTGVFTIKLVHDNTMTLIQGSDVPYIIHINVFSHQFMTVESAIIYVAGSTHLIQCAELNYLSGVSGAAE